MNAIQSIRKALTGSKDWTMGLIMDLQDSPLVQPTAAGGNHALWLLGHLAYSEAAIFDIFAMGQENRYAEWQHVFGMGTDPTANADDYPDFDELPAKFEAIRTDMLAHLESLSDDDLDAPSHAPEQYGASFSTVGACYLTLATHMAFHGGQAADIRRSLGRPPLVR